MVVDTTWSSYAHQPVWTLNRGQYYLTFKLKIKWWDKTFYAWGPHYSSGEKKAMMVKKSMALYVTRPTSRVCEKCTLRWNRGQETWVDRISMKHSLGIHKSRLFSLSRHLTKGSSRLGRLWGGPPLCLFDMLIMTGESSGTWCSFLVLSLRWFFHFVHYFPPFGYLWLAEVHRFDTVSTRL